MSNWKNHAYLFANGKFGIHWNNDRDGTLLGYSSDENLIEVSFKTGRNSWCFLANCQLIARPISDMTDEEIKNNPDQSANLQEIEHAIEKDLLWSKELIYLLSIGVYCLPDTTDVIFKPKTEQP